MMRTASKPRAFTLVEMLVVILLIAVLIAVLLPALARARETARQVTCASNLRQFGVAFTNYATQNRGIMPPCYANLLAYLQPYLANATVVVQSATAPVGVDNEVFRCKSDFMNGLGLAGYSYCFNFVGSNWPDNSPTSTPDTASILVREYRASLANRNWSPLSVLDRCSAYSNPLGLPVPGTWRRGEAKYYSTSPADTYLMLEYWGQDMPRWDFDLIDITNWSKRCKAALNDEGDCTSNTVNTVYTTDGDRYWEDADTGKLMRGTTPTASALSAQQWLANWATWRGPWGAYPMFYGVTGFKYAYHRGSVNILSIDGHVEPTAVINVAGVPVRDNKKWTATLD